MAKLTDFNQFVLVRVVPQANGKADKIPVDTQGNAINPHDSRYWLSHAEATQRAEGSGFRIGFTLTADDPFFCLDLDACLLPDRSGWTPLATEMCDMFRGAMVEISQSLSGLHIWGTSRGIPPHKCKNIPLGIELYHEKRFILLGVNAEGDESVDCTAVLPMAVKKWFAPDATTDPSTAQDWTSEAVEGWSGSEDDGELLKAMLASGGAATAFGGKVSFRDLWEANVDALGTMWPDDVREYDASSADAALAQRLAFWTGKNCERIADFMQDSGLVREKYDRADYLRRTILNACARQVQIYNKPTPAKAEGAVGKRGWIPKSETAAMFKGYVYIRDQNGALCPDGEVINPATFNNELGGRVWVLDEHKTTRNAWDAFVHTPEFETPRAHSLCFRPEVESGAIIQSEGRVLANCYVPITTEAIAGNAAPFLELLDKLYPNGKDKEYLLCYLAALVQNPGRKFQWAPLLQGCEGNGKTLIIEALTRTVGEIYSHSVNAQELGGNGGKFNGWIANKLLVVVEEVYTADKREVLEVLKPLITNARIEIQSKGQNQYTGDNRANFVFTSNYADAIPLTENSRRYGIFLSAQQSSADLIRDGMDTKYFSDLWDWFEGRKKYAGQPAGWKVVCNHLKTLNIPAEMSPAEGLQRPPKTTTTQQVIDGSHGRVEQEIEESISQGKVGFAGGWVSTVMLTKLLDEKRLSSRVPLNRYTKMMATMGYVPHPSLPNSGRTGSVVTPDNARTRLFVKEGSPHLQLNEPHNICQAYMKAQAQAATVGVFDQTTVATLHD